LRNNTGIIHPTTETRWLSDSGDRKVMKDKEFKDYIVKVLDDIQPGNGFILAMADNVPADADFDRVAMISQIVDDYYGFK
jgi:hypothetical protein